MRFGVLGVACAAALALPAAAAGAVTPFGKLTCVPTEGVRFCEGSVATRVPTFDGVPLDVNVTLPAKRSKNLPLVIQLHGWAGSKSGLGSSKEWAEDGYAVLNYTARGFGQSCGSVASRTADPDGCARGWVHLADSRYEARDSQYLAGLLADQGIVAPRRIGVTGGSYGGGQSLTLATLRDRVRLRNGKYVPWRSPKGKRMEIAAAAPQIPWSDLVASLTPNGGTLDTEVTGPFDDLSPVGIMKLSYQNILYGSGMATGFYAPEGRGPERRPDRMVRGRERRRAVRLEPLRARAVARDRPLPLGVLPEDERAARAHADLERLHGRPVPGRRGRALREQGAGRSTRTRASSQFHFDYGHPRGQGKEADTARLSKRTHALVRPLREGRAGEGAARRRGAHPDLPARRAVGRPLPRLELGRAQPAARCATRRRGARTVLSSSGSQAVSRAIDPITGQGACASTPAADEAGTASYRLPAAPGSGYTLLGSPAVSARFAVTGRDPALAIAALGRGPRRRHPDARGPRACYGPRKGSRQVFQLHPNGWRFAAGHVPKLELVGRDSPYGRPSNFDWSIQVSDLELRLPVHDKPGGAVKKPKRPFER